jgi:serine/threonine-protein kinase
MGDVYEAWDIVLARPVALKILQHLEPAAMIRFMHEAQLHARLDSPNICRIYDVDATGGTPRIAMQLIRGPNLEDAAKDLRLDEIVSILAQVADAVHGAHLLNLIHRDIKPSNILLQWNDPSGWTPYICDFGLAMAMDGPSVTQPFAITGTPAYMAPEQVRGDRSLVGPPTDVYGIGSTLYFTLLGRPPCVSTTTAEMLRVKRERGFPAPRALAPDLPPALEAILLKCLEPAPQNRYASAADLAEELRRFRATLSQAEPAPEVQGRVRAWVRRHRTVLAGFTVLAILGAAAPAVAGYLSQQRQRRIERAQIIALEGASLEEAIQNERLLPAHDLRPAFLQARARMAALRARLGAPGSAQAGPLLYALGRAGFLLDDIAQAETDLAKAWAGGYRTANAAFLRAQIQVRIYQRLCKEAGFRGQAAPPEAAAALALANGFFLRARLQTSHSREFAEGLQAALRGDDAHALELARKSLAGNPWDLASATLASDSLCRLAKDRLDSGDADGAEAGYREALDLARTALARGQSSERLHHAQCTAALGLAAIALENGELSSRYLSELEQMTEQQLQLDPGRQDAQSDWLQARSLKILAQWGQGQDPRPTLDRAMEFYWTRTREPRDVELRTDHMVLYWLQAEWDFAQGEDPAPSLNEAMNGMGHAATRFRDFQGDLLNFKATFEAAQGLDPRPTVETTVAWCEPLTQQPNAWAPSETAAKAWLIQASWEIRRGIDPMDSIHHAQTLLQRALEIRPTSASGHALQGESIALEARWQPGNRKWLLARATEHLHWSRRLNPADRELARLQALLSEPARN